MSTISANQVKQLADIAHITLTDQEVEQLVPQIASIADAASKVTKMATESIAPTCHPIALSNVMREDKIGEVLDREELLSQAPDHENGMFKVPRILEEN